MTINLSKSKIIIFLLTIAILLIIIHVSILIIYYTIGDPEKFNFIRMFDLDMERNVPTLFSSLLLAISSFLFYLLSQHKKEQMQNKHRYWFGLSIVFIFLSFDESAKIHEQLGDFIAKYIDATGYLYYPWVIIYGILLIFLALIYMKFFLRMPKSIFWSFMLAAIIYLSGAVGLDILGANESSAHGTATITYSIFYTIEESLEMFGVIYLIFILLKLLDKNLINILE